MSSNSDSQKVLTLVFLVCLVFMVTQVPLSFGQSTSRDASSASKTNRIDQYDRTAQVWYYQRIGTTGWQRGEEIYYMKCWICHNKYTRSAEPDPEAAAPTLVGLYQRSKLLSGEPVNDQTVKQQIRMGSARMPGYAPVLNDTDLSDLIAYLREKCCWDEMHPPLNPRYHPQ